MFALLGTAGTVAAHMIFVRGNAIFEGLTVYALLRAHYLVNVRGQGGRTARFTVWAGTLVSALLWSFRLF
ncbi:hypothetical protein HRbin08_00011 [bacterium HR08]|nr:hypothetical protein HRbin08_00011 [bacterium HR08]